jgi:hypothetical protein
MEPIGRIICDGQKREEARAALRGRWGTGEGEIRRHSVEPGYDSHRISEMSLTIQTGRDVPFGEKPTENRIMYMIRTIFE